MANSPSFCNSKCHERTRDIKLVLCFLTKLKLTHPLVLSVNIYYMPTKARNDSLYLLFPVSHTDTLGSHTDTAGAGAAGRGRGRTNRNWNWSWARTGQSCDRQSLGNGLARGERWVSREAEREESST